MTCFSKGKSSEENMREINCNLLLINIYEWKRNYVEKIKEHQPNISSQELEKKIKKAKARRFKQEVEILIYDELKKKQGNLKDD